jgi:hypothetical protein
MQKAIDNFLVAVIPEFKSQLNKEKIMSTKKHKELVATVIARQAEALSIAEKLFGAQANVQAAHEIYDCLKEVDAEECVPDFIEAFESAKTVYKRTPTVEEVFDLFDRIWNDDDDEDEDEDEE